MITYLKMKRAEWKVKGAFYQLILDLMKNSKDIIKLGENLFTTLKDTPADAFEAKLVSNLAELIHNDKKEKEEK